MIPGNLVTPAPPPSPGPAAVVLIAPAGGAATEVWGELSHTEQMLARFGLTVERREFASARDAETYGREISGAGGGGGPSALIVGSPDTALPAALARGIRGGEAAAATVVLRVPIVVPHAAGADAALRTLWPDPPAGGAADPGEGVFATVAIGEAGAKNAALLAVAILALRDAALREALRAFRREQTDAVLAATLA